MDCLGLFQLLTLHLSGVLADMSWSNGRETQQKLQTINTYLPDSFSLELELLCKKKGHHTLLILNQWWMNMSLVPTKNNMEYIYIWIYNNILDLAAYRIVVDLATHDLAFLVDLLLSPSVSFQERFKPIAMQLRSSEAKILGPRNLSGWWFQRFVIFTPIWGRFPIWRSYFSKGLKPPASCGSVDETEVKGKSSETLRIPRRRHRTWVYLHRWKSLPPFKTMVVPFGWW